MTRSSARSSRPSRGKSPVAPHRSRTIPDRLIEAAWLSGIVLVPLLFSPSGWFTFYNDPKYVLLHVVGLVIVVAWVWDWTYSRRSRTAPDLSRIGNWAGRRPGRWAVLAVASLAVTSVVSTLLSPVLRVSLWGRDPNDLGYELYSALALLAVFFAVALRLRTVDQLRRIMLTLAGVGTVAAVYGLSQRFGWDPLGPGEDAGRVFASFGNPILLGSFLVMSTAITVAAAVNEARGGRRVWLVAGAFALALQIAALWFTGSRGPWIGYATGTLAFVAIGYLWLERRVVIQGLVVVGAGIAIALVITLIPASTSGDERDLGDLGDVGAIFAGSSSGTLGERVAIWESIFELTAGRDWEPDESGVAALYRPLIGYGPEMFFYSYPLGIDVEPYGTVAANAHNFPLQLLIELGLAGLVSFIVLSLLAVYAALRVLRAEKSAGRGGEWLAIATSGVLAALVGRALEQMLGVARVGDLLPYWALIGLLVAAAEISSRRAPDSTSESETAARAGTVRPTRSAASTGVRYAAFGATALVTVAAVSLVYFHDVQILRASAIGRNALDLREQGFPNEALAEYQRAADIAPGIQVYHLAINDLFRKAAVREEAAGNRDVAILGWEGALQAAERYADRDPKAYVTQSRMAQAEGRLVGLGRVEFLAAARARYISIAASQPSFPSAQTEAARGMLAIGEDALGVEYAERALRLEPATGPNPDAWWLHGVGLERLGRLELAIKSYATAIERSPESQAATDSHLGLAAIYQQRGDIELAERERTLAEEAE